jgi:hypothetical protein
MRFVRTALKINQRKDGAIDESKTDGYTGRY